MHLTLIIVSNIVLSDFVSNWFLIDHSGKRFHLNKTETSIGKDDCDIQLEVTI